MRAARLRYRKHSHRGSDVPVGMEQVAENSLTIHSAHSPHSWPTKSANLQIVEFWAGRIRPSKSAAFWVDGEEVPTIGSDLEPYGRIRGRPSKLRENEDRAFIGSIVLGIGFTLTEDQRDEVDHPRSLQRRDYPALPDRQGSKLRSDCSASRWVIDFQDWPLAHAEEYSDRQIALYAVSFKPFRDRNKRANYRELWWRFGERCPGLYKAIKELDYTLVIARVSSSLAPARVPTSFVYSDKCVVFATDSLALLQRRVRALTSFGHFATARR